MNPDDITPPSTPNALQLLEQARMLLAQSLDSHGQVQATQIELLEQQNKLRIALAEAIRLIESVQRELQQGIDRRVEDKVAPIRRDVEKLRFRLDELEKKGSAA